MSVNVIITPIDGSKVTGIADDNNTVILEKRETASSGGKRETIDTYGGTNDAIRKYYLEISTSQFVNSINISQIGNSAKMTVIWGVDLFNGQTPEDDNIEDSDGEQWSVSPIEIPTALAAHPYFQADYIAEVGDVIETALAAADLAINNGEEFIATGPYAEWVRRYYALRMAGVEEWPQLGVQITRRFETDDDLLLAALQSTAFRVVDVAAIGIPPGLSIQIGALQKIVGYADSNPNSFLLEQGTLEWLHRAPEIVLTRVANQIDRYSVVDTYWGIWKWSSVLYRGGTWDPKGEVES